MTTRRLDRPNPKVHLVVLAGGYMVLLSLSALGIGMILDLYDASGVIWLGTLAITAHLAWSGPAAISLAMVWILILIWLAVLIFAIPKGIQWSAGYAWALSLLVLWLQSVLYVGLLGFARCPLALWKLSRFPSFLILLGMTWSALGVGTLLYP